MIDKLKKKIAEFAEIAKSCPENLQEKCFEILLDNYLDTLTRAETTAVSVTAGRVKKEEEKEKQRVKQQEITQADLHVKSRRFLKKYNVTLDEINQIFYKEGDKLSPLFDDLKTTKSSESQIRIALLKALEIGLIDGEFSFNGEEIRHECEIRKCYDRANFTSIFKKNAELFYKFEKYTKTSPRIKLSEKGFEQLAELIKELQ